MRRSRFPPAPDARTGAGSAASSREKIAAAVASFQAGGDREDNFWFLYETFFPKLERFFARKGFAPQDRLDLTQDTFVGIYRGLDGFRSDSRFEVWVYRVANTTYLKKLRTASTEMRRGWEIPLDDAVGAPACEAPASQLESMLEDEMQREMQAAIRRLPEQMRKCLTLRLYHGLKYREIADVLKLKIDTVKVHLFKARKKLKDELRACSLEHLDF